MNHCLFCGPTTRKITEEHLVSAWISRRFALLGIKFLDADVFIDGRQGRTKTTHSITARVRGVCVPCNGIWLSGIETRLETFFFEMIRGRPAVLTNEMQVTLIAWLTRLAMVDDFRRKDLDAFYTQEQRETFRAQWLPPRDTWIWLARYAGRRSPAYVGGQKLYFEHNGGLFNYRFIVSGFIGRVAFQILSTRWPKGVVGQRRNRKQIFRVIKAWGPILQLWPAQTVTPTWPPNRVIQRDEILKCFCDRFGGKTTLTPPP